MKTDPQFNFMKLATQIPQEVLDEWAVKHKEKHTPGLNNSCKEEGCDGKVVCRVSHWSRGQFYYRSPACDKCKRRYNFAKNVPKVGRENFEVKMNQMYF